MPSHLDIKKLKKVCRSKKKQTRAAEKAEDAGLSVTTPEEEAEEEREDDAAETAEEAEADAEDLPRQ